MPDTSTSSATALPSTVAPDSGLVISRLASSSESLHAAASTSNPTAAMDKRRIRLELTPRAGR